MAGSDIKYDIIADATQFGNGIRAAEKDAQRLQKTVMQVQAASSRAMQSAYGGSNRGALMFQQLGYAAEDAASQFGTQGFAGAARAASNNISAMTAMIHPAVGAITGITIAAVTTGIAFMGMEKDAHNAAKEIESVGNAYDRLAQIAARQVQFNFELKGLRTDEAWQKQSESNSKAIAEQTKQLEARRREIKNQEAALKVFEATEKNVFRFWTAEGQYGLGTVREMMTGETSQRVIKTREEIETTKSEAMKLQQQVEQIKREQEILQQFRPEVKKRAEIDETIKLADERLKQEHDLAKVLEEQSRSPMEIYKQRVKEINQLRLDGIITEKEAAKYAEATYEELRKQGEAHRQNNQLLAGAMDIRSAEAFGVIAKSQAMAMRTGQGNLSRINFAAIDGSPATRSMVEAGRGATGGVGDALNKSDIKPLIDIEAKALGILEKQLHEFGRRPSISVVGLN